MNVKPEETKPEHKPTNEPTSATGEQLADLLPTESDAEQVKGGTGTVTFKIDGFDRSTTAMNPTPHRQ